MESVLVAAQSLYKLLLNCVYNYIPISLAESFEPGLECKPYQKVLQMKN